MSLTLGRRSLASAAWADRRTVERELSIRPGDFWLGRSDTDDAVPLGYSDDRHICLTCGTRNGKGTSIIIPNICAWPGSIVVVDPKGENATITATRRGNGSAHVIGLGQKVYVLDPFKAANVPEEYRATFNPLDALDPADEDISILAGEVANALILQSPDAKDNFFNESARDMIKALILHVRTSIWFDDPDRNLLTIRRLLRRGAWKDVEELEKQNKALPPEKQQSIPSGHALLWQQVKQNDACGGDVLQDAGLSYIELMRNAPETFEGARQTAIRSTDFVEDPAMSRQLSSSTRLKQLGELKSDEKGISLYLTLPDDYMETHSRWLRLMITLTIGACRKLNYQPKSGHQVLMVLDEFAGLQRMPLIENAVAKMAGYGLKMFFVLQGLDQLKDVYPGRWNNFLGNCGLNIFFGISRLDLFTGEHVSKSIGETEIVRITRSITLTHGETLTVGDTITVGKSLSTTQTTGTSQAQQRGWSNSKGDTITKGRQGGTNQSVTSGISGGESVHWGQTTGVTTSTGTSRNSSFGPGGSSSGSGSNESTAISSSSTSGGGRHTGWSHATTNGVSEGWSDSVSRSLTGGLTGGVSDTVSLSTGDTAGVSYSDAHSISRSISQSLAMGATETLHVRPLLQPYEINALLQRVQDERPSAQLHPDYKNAAYPGMALVMIDGENPFVVRRANYYEDPCFVRYFDKHPHYERKETRTINVLLHWLRRYFQLKDEELMTVEWLVEPNARVLRGETVVMLSAKGERKPAALPIVAVNDGIISSLSCPNGDQAKTQIISYELLTSLRSPRPDMRETDVTLDLLKANEMRALKEMAIMVICAAAALGTFLLWLFNRQEFNAMMDALGPIIVGLGIVAALIYFVVLFFDHSKNKKAS